MIRIDMFSLNIGTVMVRFFLMMAVIIVGVFTGMTWLTLLGLPVFLSALMGVSFVPPQAKPSSRSSQITVERKTSLKRAS